MAYPKIIYDPGTGAVTLNFTYPPVQKPMLDDREAVRHDSISTSGVMQSVIERIEKIKTLQMDNVPWEDLPAWEPFIDYAVTGAQFQYFPDADLSSFNTYQFIDGNFNPSMNGRGLSKFTLKLRLVPGGAFA